MAIEDDDVCTGAASRSVPWVCSRLRSLSAIVSTVWGGRADGACGEVHLWRGRRDVPGQQALSVPRLRQNDEAETDSKLLNLGE
jgi:hypothetical protein